MKYNKVVFSFTTLLNPNLGYKVLKICKYISYIWKKNINMA